LMASSFRPGFRTAWRGYDPSEVDRFLEDISAERQYLHERVASLEALCAQQRESSPEALLRVARAEAHAIRARPEGDPRRTLESAEKMATRVLAERLEASRDELDRLNAARSDLQHWIKSSVGAIGQAHELLAARIPLPPAPIGPPSRHYKGETNAQLSP